MSNHEPSCRTNPSALRNRDPIIDVLRAALPSTGLVLEIASGSGEHVIHFARHLPTLIWQPSDPSSDARSSIAGWIAAESSANIRPPIDLDASLPAWPIDQADAVIAINMVHISPWSATRGLLAGAARLLPSGGLLMLYGPYRQREAAFAPSNALFDQDLRSRDPAWGIRNLEDVEAAARESGLVLGSVVAMPANNLTLLFRR